MQAEAGLSPQEGNEGKLPGGAPASFTALTFKASNGQVLRYSLYVPKTRTVGERLPVVLCLHGRAVGTEAPLALTQSAVLAKHPCIIIAPGIDGAKERWVPSSRDGRQHRVVLPELIETLDAVIRCAVFGSPTTRRR